MSASNNLPIALSLISVLSSATPCEVASQSSPLPATVFCWHNGNTNIASTKIPDTASIDFNSQEFLAPPKSFATRYSRIAKSEKFKNAYVGYSLGERILVE